MIHDIHNCDALCTVLLYHPLFTGYWSFIRCELIAFVFVAWWTNERLGYADVCFVLRCRNRLLPLRRRRLDFCSGRKLLLP